MLKFSTAGESHGPALVAIVEGIPAGLKIEIEDINSELKRRKLGVGRGGRMKIETDEAKILSGVRHARSLGSPIAVMIENLDHKNWSKAMATFKVDEEIEAITVPRPGHADLSGLMRTGSKDVRDILERASARETAARVAVGAISKLLLKELGITILSHVKSIGSASCESNTLPAQSDLNRIDASSVRAFSKEAEEKMVAEIEKAAEHGYSLGGVFEVLTFNLPPGIGGYGSAEARLDGRLAGALMSIPAIKGVEFGVGFKLSERTGDLAHDEIFFEEGKGFYRKTNHAGGIEGGMTNGEILIIRAAMKPIPTLAVPLQTIDIVTKERKEALKERADVCAVPAAAVVAESVVAFELCKAIIEKFGGDCVLDLKSAFDFYLNRIKNI